MKKSFTYLKALFLVMLLFAGSVAVWGQSPDWQYTFTAANNLGKSGSTNTLAGWEWKLVHSSTASNNFDSGSTKRGIQIGTAKAPAADITLSTNSCTESIGKIIINTSGASDIIGNLKVYVGDTQIGSTYTLTNVATDVTFSTTAAVKGEIKLVWSQTSSKAIYIKSMEVFYQQITGPATEVTPENIESIGELAKDITASGDWTERDIDQLVMVIFANTVNSIKFTGSIASTTPDEILNVSPNCLKIFPEGVVVPDAWTDNVVKLDASGNATAEKIVLNATSNFGAPMKITAATVLFSRENLTTGNKSTIYLPFATSVPQGATAFTFDKVEETTVKFTPVEGVLAANTPYLFTPNGTDLAIEETNVDIIPAPEATPATGYEFLGTYEEIQAEGFYGFKDNSFKLGIAGATVPAFRAYLKPATSPSGAPAVLSIDINGEGTTGIENTVFEGTTIYATDGVVNVLTDQTQKVSIYGIDGKLVRSETVNPGMNTIGGLAKGMYVVNNQRVIIK